MMLRKQTVWLLTMLAVMVVLSGYYLVKGPTEQMPALGNEQKEQPNGTLGMEVDTKEADPSAIMPTTPLELNTTLPATDQTADATLPETKTTTPDSSAAQQSPAKPTSATQTPEAVSTSDFFTGYKMQREAMLQKQKDEQFAIMTSDKSSAQAYAEAKKKHEELSTLENNTIALEELLKGSGYKDAVVLTQNDKVNVIVQADKLTNKEVVDIIAQVKQQLSVSGNNVIVQSKP
ncbi:MAG: SpoIIIAH-like family protein [Clostridia bacterium]